MRGLGLLCVLLYRYSRWEIKGRGFDVVLACRGTQALGQRNSGDLVREVSVAL